MRIMITGASGRLGNHLVEILQDQHTIIPATRNEFDITDFALTRQFIRDQKPDLVLHAAAWTDVDGCAKEPERAIAINGMGSQNVAIAAEELNAAILYISSNEVFYGQLKRPYLEYDSPNPHNAYGYSKLVGERTVAAVNKRHYIVRTSWIFAHGGKNFIQTILRAADAGRDLKIVTDEVANPTYNNDLADAIGQLIETGRYGIYHLVNQGACSRYMFARYVLDRAGYPDLSIQPISSSEWRRASVPPAYTALSNLSGTAIGIRLRPWQKAVDAFLDQEGLRKSGD